MTGPAHASAVSLRLGTRGSALALAQTEIVADALRDRYPGLIIERVVIRTEGDVDKVSPLTQIGGRGVFTSALQEAVSRHEIDAAVHSAKDLPSEQPLGLALVAFLAREDPRDVLASRHGRSLAELPAHPTIGTSSRRRAVQIRALRPDATIVELRGNVDTRMRKALETDVDGIVLAAAGVRRMGFQDRVCEYLPLDRAVPSPGQGALAVEARADDTATVRLLAALDAPAVSAAVRVERAFLRAVGGGCTTPVGAYASLEGDRLRLRAMLASEDGARVEWADELLEAVNPEKRAAELAVRLLGRIRAAGGITFGYHPVAVVPEVDQAGTGGGIVVPAADAGQVPGTNGVAHLSSRPLAGLTVLVTRAQDQASELSAALRQAGAEPLALPTLRITAPTDPAPLDAALREIAARRYDWVVFTSANAVARVVARAGALNLDEASFAGTQVAAVGAAPAATLRAAGIAVDQVPERFRAEAVVGALAARGVGGPRVRYPRGNHPRDTLPHGLRAVGGERWAGKARLIDEQHAVAGVAEQGGEGGAGDPGADDERVEGEIRHGARPLSPARPRIERVL